MINSRKLEDLDPHARNICNQHLALCHEAGIELILTSTYRDFEAQTELYAIGRTVHVERVRVTDAKAGHSWHNFKCAWDVVPVVGGKAMWHSLLWKEVIKFGLEAGAQRGPDWDMPHFQVVPLKSAGLYIDLDEARDRLFTHGTIFTA